MLSFMYTAFGLSWRWLRLVCQREKRLHWQVIFFFLIFLFCFCIPALADPQLYCSYAPFQVSAQKPFGKESQGSAIDQETKQHWQIGAVSTLKPDSQDALQIPPTVLLKSCVGSVLAVAQGRAKVCKLKAVWHQPLPGAPLIPPVFRPLAGK